MAMVGGMELQGEILALALAGIGCGFVLRLSAAMFGISGFRWCRRYGTVARGGVVAASIVQFLPVVDVIGTILCYSMFRKEGQPKV